ncbi:MAG: hypothetical protein BYD32DRAFT_435367 [Podila humilis]|nr:MAG: hypothetical protein BYD32DRAFT_435367 [Podila humilis]
MSDRATQYKKRQVTEKNLFVSLPRNTSSRNNKKKKTTTTTSAQEPSSQLPPPTVAIVAAATTTPAPETQTQSSLRRKGKEVAREPTLLTSLSSSEPSLLPGSTATQLSRIEQEVGSSSAHASTHHIINEEEDDLVTLRNESWLENLERQRILNKFFTRQPRQLPATENCHQHPTEHQQQTPSQEQENDELEEEENILFSPHEQLESEQQLTLPPPVSQLATSLSTASRPPPIEVDVPTELDLMIHFRARVANKSHARVRDSLPPPEKHHHCMNSLGFPQLMTAIRYYTSEITNFTLEEANPWLQPTHTATQKKYKELTSANCNSSIAVAYVKESRRLIKESKHAGIHASSMPVQINVFVYLKELAPPQGSTGGTTQRRATKRRIENTMERMNQDPDFQGLGPGWKHYMATAMARKGAGDDPMDTTPLPVIPDGTTY